MTEPLESTLVAAHWPFVSRHLTFHEHALARFAMSTLARLQYDAGGCPVPLGPQRLLARADPVVTTDGEARAFMAVMRELERRGVVVRSRATGSRPDSWAFRTDVRRWRGMPWSGSGKDVATAIGACVCRAVRAIAARSPGQSVALPRGGGDFWLSAADHLTRPGLFLVDTRGYCADRDATARRPGETPVDSRGYGAASAGSVLSSGDLLRDLSLGDEERERFEAIRKGIGGQIWGRLRADVAELARRPYTPDQLAAALRDVEAYRLPTGAYPQAPMKVARLAEVLESPAIRALASTEG